MDRMMLERNLVQAQRHISIGEVCLARQRRVIAKLKHNGEETSFSMDVLARFEELQTLHVADRDRLEKALQSAGAYAASSMEHNNNDVGRA
jgi:hypothetical protein